jgi:hypothetical protein
VATGQICRGKVKRMRARARERRSTSEMSGVGGQKALHSALQQK